MHNTGEKVLVSSNNSITDDALVRSARNGNEQAFGILVKRYDERILAVALRYTRSLQDAEDVVQQSWQQAFVNLKHFEGKSSFATWLTRIAINEALMLLRKGRARREVSLDNSTDIERTAPRLEIRSGRPDPEAICLHQERVRMLSKAMVKLRPGIREAIQLRDLDELSTEDTARRMGLSVAGTKARVLQGRRKLRSKLMHYMVCGRSFDRNGASSHNKPRHTKELLGLTSSRRADTKWRGL